jgi:hypothetical protein
MTSPSLLKTALLAVIATLFTSGSLLAQSTVDTNVTVHAGGTAGGLIPLILAILVIAGLWKIFVKAGQPGWASIIPIYNTYILCKIVGKPGWWVILLFIPFVNLIIAIILMVELAKSFGKGIGFAIGMLLLGFIFIPILGFGDATYQGRISGQ